MAEPVQGRLFGETPHVPAAIDAGPRRGASERARAAGRRSSPGTPRAMTSACGCAVSNSRRAFGSFGWSARAPTTWWSATRRTRAPRRCRTPTYVAQELPARQGRSLRGVSGARAAACASWRHVGAAHDAKLDVHQAVQGLRKWLLETFDLRALGDFDRGASTRCQTTVVSVVVSASSGE